jgi:hypothetical protein
MAHAVKLILLLTIASIAARAITMKPPTVVTSQGSITTRETELNIERSTDPSRGATWLDSFLGDMGRRTEETMHGIEGALYTQVLNPAKNFLANFPPGPQAKLSKNDKRHKSYSKELDEAISLSEQYLDEAGPVKWVRVKGEGARNAGDGVDAWVAEKSIPTSFADGGDTYWPVIKAQTVIRGKITPEQLAELLMDSNRVAEYNDYAVQRKDIEMLRSDKDVREKVIYAQTRNPFKLKPYDFVSLMRSSSSPTHKGGMRLITRYCSHPEVPPDSSYSTLSLRLLLSSILLSLF